MNLKPLNANEAGCNTKDGKRDYEVRRIFSETEAKEIFDLQKKALVFRDNYPGYDNWIEMALGEVVNGKRVAFGAFKAVIKESKPTVRLVGSMIVKEEKYGSAVELKNLFVGEEFRRQGYGMALENAVEKHYSKKRYRIIKTEVPAKEKNTITFLLNCGYRVLITKESAHKAGEYVTEMYKELPLKYGGDYYDRSDFFSWLLFHNYELTLVERIDNYLTFSLEPKLKNQGYDTAVGRGVFFVNDEKLDVNTKVIQDFLAKHSGAHIKMLFGRHVSQEAKVECDRQGIMVFDEPSILRQFGDCFAYKPPEFMAEEIAGTVVVVNGEYIERMQELTSEKTFTYFKGGSVGKYLKRKDKVLFFFTRSQKCPESAVLAFAEVVGVQDESPDKIWGVYKSRNPLFSEKEYKTFVENKQTILAIECTNLNWIYAISPHELCSIAAIDNFDVDDIGHLYLSSKMVIDFLEKRKLGFGLTDDLKVTKNDKSGEFEYDVALSFAGEDREYAEQLYKGLHVEKVAVFYDEAEKAKLWGKDLYTYLSDLYSKRTRFCIVFMSKHYAAKGWTIHERKAAQSRALIEGEREFILPIRLDETEIPGILPTVGYLEWKDGIAEIVRCVREKLGIA